LTRSGKAGARGACPPPADLISIILVIKFYSIFIVSFFPGRIRLRFGELKNKTTADTTAARIKETPGITKVEVNIITGSILIEYDAKILPPEKLIETGKRELAKLGIHLEVPRLPEV
jgi:copper chaperone CopZ